MPQSAHIAPPSVLSLPVGARLEAEPLAHYRKVSLIRLDHVCHVSALAPW